MYGPNIDSENKKTRLDNSMKREIHPRISKSKFYDEENVLLFLKSLEIEIGNNWREIVVFPIVKGNEL
jgi:hypothetical protein